MIKVTATVNGVPLTMRIDTATETLAVQLRNAVVAVLTNVISGGLTELKITEE